jgi:hypothetical protein
MNGTVLSPGDQVAVRLEHSSNTLLRNGFVVCVGSQSIQIATSEPIREREPGRFCLSFLPFLHQTHLSLCAGL